MKSIWSNAQTAFAAIGGFLGWFLGGNAAALSADGRVFAVAHNTTPFISTYDWGGSAWIRRPNPAILPTGHGRGAALSVDGSVLAVGHDTSPFLSTYDWNGTAWLRRPNPAALPPWGASVALSSDGSVLAAAATMLLYDWVGSAWLMRPAPVVSPYTGGSFVALSADGSTAAVSSGWSATDIRIYDTAARTTNIRFDTAPPAGASITADYIVDGVHKTDQFVIDVGFSIQYGTPA